MDQNKKEKLYSMLTYMSDYSAKQPKEIERLCDVIGVEEAYAPAIDLLVEAFLTIRSFALLMFEGLISNASAILRILIEQVATMSVISRDQKALGSFLKFQRFRAEYYGSSGNEHNELRNYLVKQCGHNRENAIKNYLDYGWIKTTKSNKSERGNRLIIKEARLEEMIVDINEQLNAFAHGQRSIFQFLRNKDLGDKHVSRIIMASGKLFLFLCKAKQDLLMNDDLTFDNYFHTYLNAKVLYLDLNARAVWKNIVDIIKKTDNLDREIVYTMSTFDHTRGLMYQSSVKISIVNSVACSYAITYRNLLFMLLSRFLLMKKQELGENENISVERLIESVGAIEYNIIDESGISQQFFKETTEIVERLDDRWCPMRKDGQFEEADELFITDISTAIHNLFRASFNDLEIEELTKSFVPIE